MTKGMKAYLLVASMTLGLHVAGGMFRWWPAMAMSGLFDGGGGGGRSGWGGGGGGFRGGK
jgi:hypothetical protein